jgi:hypothetical protein
MNGYLSPEQGGSGAVPIESRAGVYRDPDHGQEIAVETEANLSYLGIADVTVSRKKGEEAPVVFRSRPESIEVRNNGNSNGVTVRTEGDTKEIEEGFSARVRRDATIKLGYQTELRLTVEREARVEVTDGDYVAGGKTEVSDSVVNRSEIGSGQPADPSETDTTGGTVEESVVNRSQVENGGRVDDSVVNRSNVGGIASEDSSEEGDNPTDHPPTGENDSQTTTQNVCEVHDITFTGQVCPKCASEGDASKENKFCLFCGDSIPEQAKVCPKCGEELPST